MIRATRGAAEEFLALLEVVRELRQRCPWDREQTLASASRHLIEEAYEAADAIEHGGDREIDDELGDLLVQVLFAANIAEEQRGLEVAAMLRRAREKLVRRHPHVYAGVAAESSAEVVQNWDKLKQQERAAAGATSALDGVARALPALTRAQKLGERARERRDGLGGGVGGARSRSAKRLTRRARRSRSAIASMRPRRWATRCSRWPTRRVSLAMTRRRRCDAPATSSSSASRRSSAVAAERKLELATLDPQQIETLWQEAKRAPDADER